MNQQRFETRLSSTNLHMRAQANANREASTSMLVHSLLHAHAKGQSPLIDKGGVGVNTISDWNLYIPTRIFLAIAGALILTSCSLTRDPALVGTLHTSHQWQCVHSQIDPGYSFGKGGGFTMSSRCVVAKCIETVRQYGKGRFDDATISRMVVEDSKCLD